jgi:hypothetical protein
MTGQNVWGVAWWKMGRFATFPSRLFLDKFNPKWYLPEEMQLSSAAIFLLVWSIAAQSISTILPEQNGLNTFIAYISQFPEFLAQLDVGNFTGRRYHNVLHALD